MHGALRIGRVRADCLVAGAPDVAPAVGDRAARALRHHLSDALRRTFSAWLDRDDRSVWIVRRLELSVLADAEAPPDVLASAIAASLGPVLAGTLTDDGDGVNAMRFRDRAEYVAQFVVDMAAGDPWGRWYYAPLAGLKALPRSAAIRTVLVEDPGCGRDTLAALDDRALAGVVAALTPEDELRVLDAFARSVSSADEDETDVFDAARRGCARGVAEGVTRGLALFAFARAPKPAASIALLHAVNAVVEAVRAAEAAGAKGAAPAETLAARRSIAPPARTRFGGVCLLLRDLDELPWTPWTSGWPSAPAGRPETILKWLTIALCAGRDRSLAVFEDQTWRRVLEISEDATLTDMALWLREVGAVRRRAFFRDVDAYGAPPLAFHERSWFAFPRQSGITVAWTGTLARIAGLVLRRFARRLPGFAHSTPDYLWRNFLAFDAAVEDEEERVVVRCGRPPLHLVLTLTGMTRGLVAGCDTSGRPIQVFPGE